MANSPFPWFLYFTLDPYLIMLSVKKGSTKYHFWVFSMTQVGIESRYPRQSVNILPFMPMSGKVSRVFANGSGDLGLIPGRVIPKTFKMVIDTSLLNTQQYKVSIKGKVEQSRERSNGWYLSLPPTRYDLTHLGEEQIGNEPRLKPSLTMLVIDPLCVIWACWA